MGSPPPIKNTLTKRILGKKGFIWFTIPGCHLLLPGSQGRNLKAVGHIRAPNRERINTLLALSWLSPLILFRTPCLGDSDTHSGLSLPPLIGNKEIFLFTPFQHGCRLCQVNSQNYPEQHPKCRHRELIPMTPAWR